MRLNKEQIKYIAAKAYDIIKQKSEAEGKKNVQEFKKKGLDKEYTRLSKEVQKLEAKKKELLKKNKVNTDYRGVVVPIGSVSYRLEETIREEVQLQVTLNSFNTDGIQVDDLVQQLVKKFSK